MTLDPGHITEFTTDPADGHWLNGTCGETALEVDEAAAGNFKATVADMVRIYHEMRAAGQADYNGASTLYGLAREAERNGYTVALEWDYAEPFPHDWHATLLQYAGKKPILIQLANGQALSDVETGSHDNPGLRYHFIAINGTQADGYVCSDGDNPDVGNRYQVYSFGVLQAAQPCGLLILEPKGTQNVAINTTGLGAGFAAAADADVAIAETYEDAGAWSWCMLANGKIFFYDGQVHTDASAAIEVVKRLAAKANAPAPAPVQAGLPANVKSDLAAALNALNPIAAAVAAISDALTSK